MKHDEKVLSRLRRTVGSSFQWQKKKNHIETTKFLPKLDESGLSQLLWTDKMILRRCEVF